MQYKSVGRPKASEVKIREAHLLKVATDVFLERGFEKAKISEIAERAQASKSSIYSRYETKEALFEAVMLDQVDQIENAFIDVTTADIPLKEVLLKFGTHLHMTVNDLRHRAIMLAIVSQGIQFPDLAKKFWQSGPQHAVDVLSQRLAKDPEFHGSDPALSAEMFCSLCLGMRALQSLLQPALKLSDEEIKQRVEDITRHFLIIHGRK